METINELKMYTGREVIGIINSVRQNEYNNLIKTLSKIKAVDKKTLKDKSLEKSKTASLIFDTKGVFPTSRFINDLEKLGYKIIEF